MVLVTKRERAVMFIKITETMHKPQVVQQIEDIIGQELQEAPIYPDVLTGLMVVKKERPKYVVEGERLIGLNLSKLELLDSQLWEIFDLIDLNRLRALNISRNNLKKLRLSNELESLEQLDVSENKELMTLEFKGGLSSLERLIVNNCNISSLHFPENTKKLFFIQAQNSGIDAITFEEGLPNVEILDLSGNAIREIVIKGGFQNLKYLFLKGNKSQLNLSFQEPFPKLINIVNLENSHIIKVPLELIDLPNLAYLNLRKNIPKNIHKVFLNTNNCLKDARDWFAELRNGSKENTTVKLMLTGNGNAGKTTLVDSLKNNQCNLNHPSTHGIQIETWEDKEVTYNIWDFGGQEVYHGTHRLFMSSEAIQIILFTPDVEKKARSHEQVKDRIRDDMILPHTIEYWYETIKSLSPKSLFLIVQNKKDQIENKAIDEIASKYASDRNIEFRQISAKNGEGVKHLKYFLRDYAEDIPEYKMEMPTSWINVRQHFLDNLKTEDNIKIITQKDYEGLCTHYKVMKRTWDLLKRYLHHSGYIYYHKNLGDKIIADQEWALKAIYRPLDRKAEHYQELLEKEGKIWVRRLFEIFGDEYEKEDKWLFIQFLKSCGLCFKLNIDSYNQENSEKDVYLFPEFLSKSKPEIVYTEWRRVEVNSKEGIAKFRYKLPWLNYHIIQQFITSIGAKVKTTYMWRTGIYVPTPQGNFLIELDKDDKSILLSMELNAADYWLKTVMEAIGSTIDNAKWEIWQDGQFVPFKLDEQGMNLRMMKKEIVEDSINNPDKTFEDLPDVKHYYNDKILLFIAANPMQGSKLSSQSTEHSNIAHCVEDKYNVKSVFAASPTDLNNCIAKYKPTIIHFCGHAEEEGLEFHDKNKRDSKLLDPTTLSRFFQSVKSDFPNVELIFLNACLTENVAKAISEHDIQTIGTTEELKSRYAIPFASGFYTLYDSSNLEKAVRHGIRECGLSKKEDLSPIIAVFKQGRKISI